MSNEDKQPRNRPPSAKRKIVCAIIYAFQALIFVLLLIAGVSIFGSDNRVWSFLISAIPAFFSTRVSVRYFKRRHSGGFSEKDLDHKDPVLSLRPFEEDSGWDSI